MPLFYSTFIIYPLILLGSMGSLLGCLLVWQRLTFVGEALAHGALLGIGLSLLFDVAPLPLYTSICISISVVFGWWSAHRSEALTAWQAHLNSMSHGLLGVGLLLLGFFPQGLALAEMLLFGDILALEQESAWHLSFFYAGCTLLLCTIVRKLISLQISPTLVRTEGGHVYGVTLLFFGLLGAFVGLSIPLVGVFLLIGVMILPATAAQIFGTSPWGMIAIAQILSVSGSIVGFFASQFYDLPMGPSIVSAHFMLYLLLLIAKSSRTLFNK